MAQKTQWFWFQISFSFLAITHAFFDENELPAPVLKSVLRCGSNAMLNLQIGWEITDLYGKMSKVAFYTLGTVLSHFFFQTFYPILERIICDHSMLNLNITSSQFHTNTWCWDTPWQWQWSPPGPPCQHWACPSTWTWSVAVSSAVTTITWSRI